MFCATTLSRKPSLRRQGSDPDVTCAGLPDSQVQRKSQESRPLAHVLCSPLPLAAPRFLSKQTFGGGDCRDRTQLSRNPATRPKHRPRPGQAPPRLSPTPPGLRNRGPGRAGSPERLGPESTVAGTHPKGCHHGQAAPAEPGPPLPPCLTSGLDSEVKCPDLGGHREPSRYPEETRSPQIPRPLSWDGYAPPDPAQRLEEGLVAGVAGLCVSPPLTQRHRHRETQQTVNSGALWQPHAVFKGTRGTPWAIPFGKELDGDYSATAPESRAGFGQRSLNSCRVCVQEP